ncbi:MAG: hypothetical protein V8R14_08990 [Clostridia bacterium]
MKYGLIGKTLVHSYSKEIHEALEKYTYELFSLSEEEMPAFVNARDFGGLNVTIPYKKTSSRSATRSRRWLKLSAQSTRFTGSLRMLPLQALRQLLRRLRIAVCQAIPP